MEVLEDLLFQWMMTLPEEVQKTILNGYDMLEKMPDDAMEEIKEEVFTQMLDEVNYVRLIKKLKDYLSERIIETEDSDEEAECVENDTDSD
jgi:hypothetical protein